MMRWITALFVLVFVFGANEQRRHEQVITDPNGEFRCSVARSSTGQLYTAGHCCMPDKKLYLDGQETDYVALSGDIIQVGSKSYRPDQGVLTADKVKPKMRVVARIGGLSALTKRPFYFEREGTILAVLTPDELGSILDTTGRSGRYALTDIGSFAGCSGSAVYYKGKLIGVMVAGTSDYSLVSLIEPYRKE